ncbi:hypothetical protein D3C86_1752640 [compost metagenome]
MTRPVDLDELRARMHLNPGRLVGRRRPQCKRLKARGTMQVCFGQRGALVRQHGLVADQIDATEPALLPRSHRQLGTGMTGTHDQKNFVFTHAVPKEFRRSISKQTPNRPSCRSNNRPAAEY